MILSFHGADQTVTGSCHLLECAGLKILVDCGLYQGGRELAEENEEAFGFEPSQIDLLLLTHAHLDHCGRIALLVKRGFRGEIVTTAATRELARLVMLDAAHLQEEEAEHARHRAYRRGHEVPAPLYTVTDAAASFDRFGRTAAYDVPVALAEGVTVRFIDAGHILGSASLVVEVQERGETRRIVFSGDIGSPGHPVVGDPVPPPEADYVVMETTYGDRNHRRLEESVEELYRAIAETLDRGGNVIIPTFALERAQELLFFLREGIEKGRLPRWLPVFLDSPMAVSATEIMRRHPECFRGEARRVLEGGADPFAQPGLRLLRDASESIALGRLTGGAVIMAGSGMCTGGRVRHHLQHNLWREQSSVVFVGYAAPGTLARRIIDGADSVEIFGEKVRVRARIHTINGFSGHADQRELLSWHAAAGRPRTTFLVHGEPDRGMGRMAELLEARGCRTARPARGERVTLA
jgi:metallo-beta-lactamase family protein